MDDDSKIIPRTEAANLLQYMRRCAFSELDENQFVQLYGHYFNSLIVVDLPDPACSCNNQESFKTDWRPDTQSLLEKMVEEGSCAHIPAPSTSPRDARRVGFYPIHAAAGFGSLPLVKCILKNGGDMNCPTLCEQLHPFDISILNKHKSISEDLINRGFRYSDVENIIKDKSKIIATCLYYSDIKSANWCIQAGARIHKPHWKILMHQAVDRSNIEVVDWLLEKNMGDIHTRLRGNHSVLHVARTPEMVCALLERGADPTALHHRDGTPLARLLQYRRLKVAECLLQHDSSIVDQEVRFDNGSTYTALHHAAWNGYVDGVKLLVKHGANHRLIAYDGNTALGLACHGDFLPCVKYLLSLECDVNVQDKDGDTALLYATYHGNWEIVQLLLEHGADPSLCNKRDVSPLWNAVKSSSLACVKLLLRMNVDVSMPTRGCDILAHGDNLFIYDEPVTPIFVAIHLQTLSIVRALINAGAYLNGEKFSSVNFDFFVSSWEKDNKKWLEYVVGQPPSLIWWCKRKVRKQLPISSQDAIRTLTIPDILKHYLQEI